MVARFITGFEVAGFISGFKIVNQLGYRFVNPKPLPARMHGGNISPARSDCSGRVNKSRGGVILSITNALPVFTVFVVASFDLRETLI